MVIEKTTKQGWEGYPIAGSILNVQKNGNEKVVLSSSIIEAVDNTGKDALATVIDMPTKALDDDPDGNYTDNMLSVRCKGGTEAGSPYIVTFKMPTSEGNKWEVDMKLVIKEITS